MIKVILIMIVGFVILGNIVNYSFAAMATVSTDKSEYNIGDTITISGKIPIVYEESDLKITFYRLVTQFEETYEFPYAINPDGTFEVKIEITDEGVWRLPGIVVLDAYSRGHSFDDIEFWINSPGPTVTVTTDKSAYERGESIIVSGEVSEIWPNVPLGISVSSPSSSGIWYDQSKEFVGEDRTFSMTISPGGSNWNDSGVYSVSAGYGDYRGIAYFDYGITDHLLDKTRPIIILPDDIKIDSTQNSVVQYSVKAVDDVDGVIAVTCEPDSGFVFLVGRTEVWCSATDSSGNEHRASFFVIIESTSLTIPQWLKNVATFWVDDEINDDGFVQVVQYLVENEVIIIPDAQPDSDGSATEIPSWIKTNAEFWVNGQITDAEFATGIEWLIQNGIIQV